MAIESSFSSFKAQVLFTFFQNTPLKSLHHCKHFKILSLFLPSPPSSFYIFLAQVLEHFSKKPWFLLMENGIRNQDLGTSCAHCYWGNISFGCSQLSDQKICITYVGVCWLMYICIYIYTHTFVYIHMKIFPSVTICSYSKRNTSSSWCFQLWLLITRITLASSSCLFMFPLQQWDSSHLLPSL